MTQIPVVGRTFNVGGNLAPGTVLGASASASQLVKIAGALKGAFRAILTAGGADLSFEYVFPSVDDPYDFAAANVHTAGNPTTLALTTTEAVRNIDDFRGESWVLLTVTAGVGGATIGRITTSLL